MSRGKTNKLYNNFIKGLISEAGPLTYPENASTDELNTVIMRKGSRARRFGLDYEPSSVPDDASPFDSEDITKEYLWRAVDGDASLDFLCLQVGSLIKFFDMSFVPVTAGLKTFEIELTDYKVAEISDATVATGYAQMATGKGFLFIATPYIDPIVVEYDSGADDITVIPIIIQMRDFDGIDDNLANDAEPAELSKEHYYNLKNQGWVGPGSSQLGPDGGETVPDPPAEGEPGGWNPWTGDEYDTEIP